MEDVTRDEGRAGGTIDLAEARRKRARASARDRASSSRTQPARFETPTWLERSFVLPLTGPEAPEEINLPLQSRPLHEHLAPELAPQRAPELAPDLVEPAEEPLPQTPAATFSRPSAPEIDFDRVIRRSDLSRTLAHAAVVSATLTGLALATYLLLGLPPLALGVALGFALLTAAVMAVRSRVTSAPVPQLQR